MLTGDQKIPGDNSLSAATNPDIKKLVYACHRAKAALERLKNFTEKFHSLARMDGIYNAYEANSSAVFVLFDWKVTEYEMDLQEHFANFE